MKLSQYLTVAMRRFVPLMLATAGFGTARAATPVYENYLNLAGGGTSVSGDSSNYQKILRHDQSAWGGIEGFRYYTDLDKNTSLTLKGHALAGDHNYLLDLKLERSEVGYLTVGYKAFRTWYDGSGGYFPPAGASFHFYNEDQFIDRTDLWVAGAYTAPDQINFNFRYDYTTRKGLKDSTSWGDTSLTAGLGTRAIVPTYLVIDENRHIFNASLWRDGEQTSWNLAGRYEATKIDNSRNIQRAPGEKANRYVKHTDDMSTDMFMVHGSVETKISQLLSVSTAAAYYDLDANISGSRIYGVSYDPVFDPVYASRQFHDEGFRNLQGTSAMHQSFANVNLMYTPTETLTIVPALKADKTSWDGRASYVETAVGAAPALAMAQDDFESESNKSLTSLTGTLDARYVGIKNWVLSFAGEWLNSDGTLSEDLFDEFGVDELYRTTDYGQDMQRLKLTANWYARPGLSFTGQTYWKARQNSFRNTRQSNAPTGADRYPAYISHQDFETSDVNFRVSWSPALMVHLVARYDYQESTIRTQDIGLAFGESANTTSHIVSTTATWNPLSRWFVQLGANQVFDTTVTPASALTGNAGGIVLNSDNNYFSGNLSTGYALDDQTDLAADYSYLRADNYVDNSLRSTAYGNSSTTHIASLTCTRRVSPQLSYTLKYTFAKNEDVTSGGMNNFRANTIYGKVQYRF
jgi:hypothetical protein